LAQKWFRSTLIHAALFFHVRDEKTLIRDHDGIELPDFSAALSEARAAMRELAIEALRQAQAANRLEVKINDGNGRTLEVITLGGVADGNET
jgi:hypothetical protein